VDRETRSSILPVRTRYRFSSVVERGPPKPDVDCSIQSAGANVFSCLGGPLARTQRAQSCCGMNLRSTILLLCAIARSRDRAAQIAKEIAPAKLVGPFATAAAYDPARGFPTSCMFSSWRSIRSPNVRTFRTMRGLDDRCGRYCAPSRAPILLRPCVVGTSSDSQMRRAVPNAVRSDFEGYAGD
jgi:hypothetical protein